MMNFQEKIAPPLAPLTDDEQLQALVESLESEDLWVKDFIERLAGAVRELKH